MTSFNITKNVNESFNMIVPGFVENVPPAGTIYSFAQITDTISIALAHPDLMQSATATLPLVSADMIVTPTMVTEGPTVLTLTNTDPDYGILTGWPNSFNNSGAELELGAETTGGQVTGRYKRWMPFTVALAQGQAIVSARFSMVALEGSGTATYKIGCDNRGNAVAPTSYDEVNMLTYSATVIEETNAPSPVAGTVYTYNITGAVQEILNRADWVNGNVMAVMTLGTALSSGYRYVAGYSNTSYAKPSLVITRA